MERRGRCSEPSCGARRHGEGAKIKWQIVYDAWAEELVGERKVWKGMLGPQVKFRKEPGGLRQTPK